MEAGMNGFAKTARKMALLVGVACLFSAGGARAATNPASCTNDKDCVATPECGGDVCDWNHSPIMTCKAAGADPAGSDGWCSVDTDCKCYAQGARCVSPYCTFTKPSTDGGTDASTGSSGGGGCRIAESPTSGGSLAGVALGLGLLLARRRRRG
jgi:MYXO-CTERM domain-containing protein